MNLGELLGEAQWAEADRVLASAEQSGVDIAALADQLQREGAASFVKSWESLLDTVGQKIAALQSA